jgi:hypothetical protein
MGAIAPGCSMMHSPPVHVGGPTIVITDTFTLFGACLGAVYFIWSIYLLSQYDDRLTSLEQENLRIRRTLDRIHYRREAA